MMEKCLKAIENKNLAEAIEIGKQMVKTHPNSFDAYLCLAIAYYNAGDTKKALENLKKAEKLAKSKEELEEVYYHTAEALIKADNLDDALKYFNKALKLAKQNNSDTAYILSEIASIHYRKGNLEKSVKYYKEAIKAGKKENASEEFIMRTASNLGVALSKLGYHEEAIELFKILLSYGSAKKNRFITCISEINLGMIYSMIGNKAAAKIHLTLGLNDAEKLEDKELQAIAYMQLGEILGKKEYIEKAEELLKEANDACNQLN